MSLLLASTVLLRSQLHSRAKSSFAAFVPVDDRDSDLERNPDNLEHSEALATKAEQGAIALDVSPCALLHPACSCTQA